MKKVYVIKYDNGEDYEDYVEFIHAIYENKKDAQKQMKKLEKELNSKKGQFHYEKHVWVEEHDFYEDKTEYLEKGE